jgi:hypothetical protein
MARVERIYEPFLRPLSGIGPWYALAVAALGALVGLGGYHLVFTQWARGLEVTGLNSSIYWGLYIINFVFLVGASAGGIIVAALAHILEFKEFKPISRIAELQAIACLVLATLFIFVSIGSPDRFYYLFLFPQPGSPLIWDVAIIAIYLVLAMVMGYLGTRADVVRCMAVFPRRRWLSASWPSADLSPPPWPQRSSSGAVLVIPAMYPALDHRAPARHPNGYHALGHSSWPRPSAESRRSVSSSGLLLSRSEEVMRSLGKC